jgi:poly-beta-hydroxyalkanoate depolymerase
MLYQIYETQRSMMEPLVDFAKATSKVLGNPKAPFSQNPLIQRMSAGYDLMYRLGKDYVKPTFGLTTVDVNGIQVSINERIELSKPFCDLIRFKRYTAAGVDRRALVRPLCHAAARHGCHHAERPQGLHHRLEKRPPGAFVGW